MSIHTDSEDFIGNKASFEITGTVLLASPRLKATATIDIEIVGPQIASPDH